MEPLIDKYGRIHDYLRVSLTERCNLRCTYCMPEDGVDLSPKNHICTYEELVGIIDVFIGLGVKKIRLTGGEPLVRKDVEKVFQALAKRPVELAMTTNGTLLDRYAGVLEACGLKKLNISLDTLNAEKFLFITRRAGFEKVLENIHLMVRRNFDVKINVVLMRGVNDDEIMDFVTFAKDLPVSVRFIEFMPFDGNRWDDAKMVPAREIRSVIEQDYELISLKGHPNDTTKNYSIDGFKGKIGIISSMSEHFCGSCNRIRLLANGHIKNCLFSGAGEETDLLTPYRQGYDIEPLIRACIFEKKPKHAGMFELAKRKNRSMITIGG